MLFALFAISLVGGIATVLVNISAERRERAQVQLTSDILFALRQGGRALIDAETGQRGYVITGDPDYLAPYHTGSRDFPLAMERLEGLMGPVATPRQRELLDTMQRLGDAKLAEMSQTIDLVESGRNTDAQRLIETDRGRADMVGFRNAIGELEAIERDILADATKAALATENRIVPVLIALLVTMLAALALGLWQIFRTARAEAEARTAQSLSEARDRADLLSRELNHRVKNIFAVVQAIVRMSLRGESDTAAAANKISERINALSIAHSVTQGQLETPVARLEDLIRTAVAPYVTEATKLSLSGPEVEVVARQVTPLGLILHELVTNCVKYGAWSELGGSLDISWRVPVPEDRCVELDWIESGVGQAGAADAPGESGFGTRMIDASIRQLEGRIEREFTDRGLQMHMIFAVRPELVRA
ncbi:CHASE3 domain-containing protein [Aurantiacibacter luteus]|uniref:CHASE3 domain-containing protein n=1 Tax=Aurantiacibacter luteus TaxID=1581420 RepID=UPI0006995E91|nr:CHASE3 domain-containing protein [Aurantiacibacter luteus]